LGPGEVQPNLATFDTAPNSNGGVGFDHTSGIAAFTAGGNKGPLTGNTPGGLAAVTQFTSQTNTASYATATDFADNMIFEGLAAGTVTLSPFVVSTSTEYWTATPGAIVSPSSVSAVKYNSTHFAPSDVINNVPLLVIKIGSVTTKNHAIVAFAGTDTAGYGTQITQGTGTNQGSFNPNTGTNALALGNQGGAHGFYTAATLTGINGGSGAAIDTVEATGILAGDEEIFALDVLVNGTQASTAQLTTLVAAINAGDSAVSASTGVVASLVSPVPDPFNSSYNLFLDPSGVNPGFLGLDLSDDSNLVGYTFSEVAVVPEPMTLGLLALGGVGLMTRRHRRSRKA